MPALVLNASGPVGNVVGAIVIGKILFDWGKFE